LVTRDQAWRHIFGYYKHLPAGPDAEEFYKAARQAFESSPRSGERGMGRRRKTGHLGRGKEVPRSGWSLHDAVTLMTMYSI
jgi:hypothetical protein